MFIAMFFLQVGISAVTIEDIDPIDVFSCNLIDCDPITFNVHKTGFSLDEQVFIEIDYTNHFGEITKVGLFRHKGSNKYQITEPFDLPNGYKPFSINFTAWGTGKFNLTVVGADTGTIYASIDPWWNSSYLYRKQVYVGNENTTYDFGQGALITFTTDTATLVSAGKMRADGYDLRILYNGSGTNVEVNRTVNANNSASTRINFKVQANISANVSDKDYWIYYGYPSATDPGWVETDILDESLAGVPSANIHYPFEETSGTNVVNYGTHPDNGTASSDVSALTNSSTTNECFIGNCFDFQNDNIEVTMSDPYNANPSAITYACFVYARASTGGSLGQQYWPAASTAGDWWLETWTGITYRYWDTVNNGHAYSVGHTYNTWGLAAAIHDEAVGTPATLTVIGTVGGDSRFNVLATADDLSNTQKNYNVGGRTGSGTNYLESRLDGCRYWYDDALSEMQVRQLYGFWNTNVSVQSEEGLPFDITLNNPVDDTWNNSQTITFNYTPIAYNADITNCTLWTNETGTLQIEEVNATLVTNNTSNTITHNFGADYNYVIWNIECCDGSDCAKADNFIIKIDSTAPAFSLENVSLFNETWLYSNWTITETGIGLSSYSIYVNSSLNDTWTNTSLNFYNLTELFSYDNFNLTIQACDLFSQCGNSSSFLKNTTDETPPPQVSSINYITRTTSSFLLNWTTVDDSRGVTGNQSGTFGYELFRSLDGVSFTSVVNFTTVNCTANACNYTDSGLVADTNYYYKVKANDTAGNQINSSSFGPFKTEAVTPTPPSPGGGGGAVTTCPLGQVYDPIEKRCIEAEIEIEPSSFEFGLSFGQRQTSTFIIRNKLIEKIEVELKPDVTWMIASPQLIEIEGNSEYTFRVTISAPFEEMVQEGEVKVYVNGVLRASIPVVLSVVTIGPKEEVAVLLLGSEVGLQLTSIMDTPLFTIGERTIPLVLIVIAVTFLFAYILYSRGNVGASYALIVTGLILFGMFYNIILGVTT